MSEDSREVMGAEGKGGLGCIGPPAGGGKKTGRERKAQGKGRGSEWNGA